MADAGRWLKTEKEEGLYPVTPLEENAKVLTTGLLPLRKELQDQVSSGAKR
jgi:hypothetical protein